jgi:hypothetical protein
MATKGKKKFGLESLYAKFLASLSSSEVESIKEAGMGRAMPAFRKYLNSLSEPELIAAVAEPEKEAEEE